MSLVLFERTTNTEATDCSRQGEAIWSRSTRRILAEISRMQMVPLRRPLLASVSCTAPCPLVMLT